MKETTQYRIVAATKYWHVSNYIIEKRTWWWPFWREVSDYLYKTIRDAKKNSIKVKN